MTSIWVDTDFGFDDLWALFLLRHLKCNVAGVSLVAGNAPLEQVVKNAAAARVTYGFEWPVWQGAARPLKRGQETAQRILGPTGMRSRGLRLDPTGCPPPPEGALDAMRAWMQTATGTPRIILALGPLTNIALLLQSMPDLAKNIERLVWMGGSAGAGNHTRYAEFNALADAEALAAVTASDLALDVVDLTFCRKVTFGQEDLPQADRLTRDLLGGYLDIALERGRPEMAIYDPVAALAIAQPESIRFQRCTIEVETRAIDAYGATKITSDETSETRISVGSADGIARTCLSALERENADGYRH